MSERLQWQGRLAEKRQEAAALKLRIEGLRDSVRQALDPFAPIEDLRAELAAAQAVELAEMYVQYRERLQQIQALEKALGR